MYLSDYYYGATPTYWTYPGYHSGGQHYLNAADNNWIEAGLDEYFLTPVADDTDTIYIFFHHSTNNTGLGSSQVTIAKDVRPSFYCTLAMIYMRYNRKIPYILFFHSFTFLNTNKRGMSPFSTLLFYSVWIC